MLDKTAGTEAIGDWAYAYCSALKWLAIPASLRILGKDVFTGCTLLKYIFYYNGSNFDHDILPSDKDSDVFEAAKLNALALSYFSSPTDTLIPMNGDTLPALSRWDEECLRYLTVPDESGFAPFLAGGEEDYGDHDDQLKIYIRERQLRKARIIYTRLLTVSTAGFSISPDTSRSYLAMLHTDPEAVTLLNEIDSHFKQAAEIYANAGILTAGTLPSILSALSPDRIEIRSALISHDHDTVLGSLAL